MSFFTILKCLKNIIGIMQITKKWLEIGEKFINLISPLRRGVLSKVLSIINYGLGNIQAFLNIYNQLDIPIKVVSSHEELKKSTKLILPGVGSFDHAMYCLHRLDLVKALNYHLFERKIPILGVCVGMQIMAKMSEEGLSDGLNWVPSKVLKVLKKIN